MASKKQDFTAAESRYSGNIGAIEEAQAATNKAKGTRKYTRLDPREEAPEEYRFTVRMPGEYGRFMNELAYQRRSTITAEFQRLVAEEMERRPEIMDSLDELNK